MQEEREIVAMLAPLARHRDAMNSEKREADKIGDVVKEWMLLNWDQLEGGDSYRELSDQEHNITFRVTLAKRANWDLRKAEHGLLEALASAGLLDVRNGDFDRRRITAPSPMLDAALKHRHEGESPRLERVER